MRTLRILLLSFCTFLTSLTVLAQPPLDSIQPVSIDSTAIVVTGLTLTEDEHLLIFDCLEDAKSTLTLGYGAQIAKGVTRNAQGKPVYEPTKNIAVNVTEGFIAEVYVLMGVQQERFASGINDIIAQKILNQLTVKKHTAALKRLQSIANFNQGLKQQKINRGFNSVSAFIL